MQKAVAASDSDDEVETEEQREKRLEFEKRRKTHYNEFQAVKLARKLLEEELKELDDEESSNIKNLPVVNMSGEQKMETDEKTSTDLGY